MKELKTRLKSKFSQTFIYLFINKPDDVNIGQFKLRRFDPTEIKYWKVYDTQVEKIWS